MIVAQQYTAHSRAIEKKRAVSKREKIFSSRKIRHCNYIVVLDSMIPKIFQIFVRQFFSRPKMSPSFSLCHMQKFHHGHFRWFGELFQYDLIGTSLSWSSTARIISGAFLTTFKLFSYLFTSQNYYAALLQML